MVGVLGYAWADASDVVPGPLTAAPEPSPAARPEPVLSPPPLPESTPVVLEGVVGAPDVDPTRLAAAVDPLLADPALGATVAVSVRDLATGQELYDRQSQRPLTPASTSKVLTAVAALDVLGADATLETSTRWLPASARGASGLPAVVLVGGGDVLLSAGPGDENSVAGRAGLATLAEATVERLAGADAPGEAGAGLSGGGPGPLLEVVVDDSLLGAPQPIPQQPKDLLFAAEPASLAVAAGVIEGQSGRDRDPAARAGAAFAAALETALVNRLGPAPGGRYVGEATVTTSPVTGEPLAEVVSAPVSAIVEYQLWTSDNTVANALAGMVAAESDRPTDLASAGAVVVERAAAVVAASEAQPEATIAPTRLVDGAGLFDGSVTTAAALSHVISAASTSDDPELRALSGLLPVAGAEGTLADRYATGSDTAAAGGHVRAKTGTLSGVTTLAGVVTVSGGRGLAFAVLAQDVPGGALAARTAVDRVVAAVATCGC